MENNVIFSCIEIYNKILEVNDGLGQLKYSTLTTICNNAMRKFNYDFSGASDYIIEHVIDKFKSSFIKTFKNQLRKIKNWIYKQLINCNKFETGTRIYTIK